MPIASILDEIHPTLPPELWEDPGAPAPNLKPEHASFLHKTVGAVLEAGGYTDSAAWLHLVLTGSLTTHQYGDSSDVDVSLFVNSDVLPEWSRAEMIGLMVGHTDGTILPGTPFPLQCYVVPAHIKEQDLYKSGLRSGYDLDHMQWIVPPDPERDHDVQSQENGFYVYALQTADKMERLIRYEPDKAVQMWRALHRRRHDDQVKGKGDFSESNIIYKFLAKRGLFAELSKLTGEHIAATKLTGWDVLAQDLLTIFRQFAVADIDASVGIAAILQSTQSHLGAPITSLSPLMSLQSELGKALYAALQRHGIPDQVATPAIQAGLEALGGHVRSGPWDIPTFAKTAAEPIMESEARGNSRPVTPEEFQQLAAEGQQRYQQMITHSMPAGGLQQNWPGLQQHAFEQVQQPWGGATIDAHTGQPIRSDVDAYAMSVKEPGMETVSIPIGSNSEQFASAMNLARSRFQPILERAQHHLGIFRDDDQNRIDFDPTVVVDTPHEVETIGAHTHAIGGAYHFATGNGYFPPHVRESVPVAA